MKPVVVHLDSDISARPGMDKLTTKTGELMQRRPELVTELHDGTFELCCPLPPGYRTSMNRYATELRGRLNACGWLFEISERLPGSICGGWMASCIPPSMYRTFLAAWIAFASKPSERATEPMQLDLFAA